MFARTVVDKALARIGATPETVTPHQMRLLIDREITPEIERYLKHDEKVRHFGAGFLCLGPDGCLMSASGSAPALLGIGPGDDPMEAARRLGVIIPLEELLEHAGAMVVREIPVRKGTTLSVAMAALRDPDGNLKGQVSLIQEISLTARLEEEADQLLKQVIERNEELARSEEELRFYVAELREATEARTNLLASVSHELKTPLNAIIGFTDTMLAGADGPLSESQAESLKTVSDSAQYLRRLIENMLDLSRLESNRLHIDIDQIDTVELCRNALTTIEQEALERGLSISVLVEDDCRLLETDRTRVRQILVNLLTNALHFTKEGSIRLAVSKTTDGSVSFAVHDTGCGIGEHQQPLIWQEFFRATAPAATDHTGTGLGLSISKRLATLLGGELSLSSTAGAGSTFRLTLPRNPPPTTS